MQELIGRVQLKPKSILLAFALLLPALTVCFFPANTYAQETQDLEPPKQLSTQVESPSGVVAVSQQNDKTIVWTWQMPAHGLTPDADTVVLDEQGNPVQPQPTEHATDIVSFHYQLVKDETPIVSGAVGSEVLTATTLVTENGDYTLYVWSVNRAGEESVKSAGTTNVFVPIPNLPPIKEENIPIPLDTTPLVKVPMVESSGNTAPSPRVPSSNSPGYLTNSPSASVLSANSNSPNTINQVETAGVATTSTQGWVVLGIPWYYWLVVLAVSYIIVRVLYRFTVHL